MKKIEALPKSLESNKQSHRQPVEERFTVPKPLVTEKTKHKAIEDRLPISEGSAKELSEIIKRLKETNKRKREEMKKVMMLVLAVIVMGLIFSRNSFSETWYKWTDEKGAVHFTDDANNIPEKYRRDKFKVDESKELSKEVLKEKQKEKQKADKELDEKIRLELDYQKRVKLMKDYNAMKEELDKLWKQYQEKRRGQLDRWFTHDRGDIIKELDRLRLKYEKEAKDIRNLYGYK
jgi:hypothetical protein